MPKKQKAPPSGPSNAYLMSFGDTMTALLAFFIVLNSLAKEQTGANLHAGTGSFVSAGNKLGLSGTLSSEHSKLAVQFEEPSPFYQAEAGENEDPNTLRILDRENEEFQRLLNELDRFYQVDNLPSTRGAIVFDIFQKLKKGDEPLCPNGRKMLNQTRAMLTRPNYEVEVVVWATTPSPTAWLRAFKQAKLIAKQFSQEVGLGPEMRKRLRPVARPWLFSDEKRPTMSVVVINREN